MANIPQTTYSNIPAYPLKTDTMICNFFDTNFCNLALTLCIQKGYPAK